MAQILGFLSIVPLAEKNELSVDLLYDKMDEVFRLMFDAVSLIKKYAIKERNRK
jgi:hypothetical protein